MEHKPVPRSWGRRRYFTMAQLQEVWDSAKRRGILYNGMTFGLLREKYLRAIFHTGNKGFYYYPDSPALTRKATKLKPNVFRRRGVA